MAVRQEHLADASDPAHEAFDNEPLLRFVDELRDAGFALGVAEYLRVIEAARYAQAIAPGDPATLRRHLSPVIAGTPEQQSDFYGRFERWHRGREIVSPPPPPIVHRRAHRELKQQHRRSWLWAIAGMLMVLALTTLVARLLQPPALPDETPTVVETPTPDIGNIAQNNVRPSLANVVEPEVAGPATNDTAAPARVRIVDAQGRRIENASLVLEGQPPALSKSFDAPTFIEVTDDGDLALAVTPGQGATLWDAATGLVRAKILMFGDTQTPIGRLAPDGERFFLNGSTGAVLTGELSKPLRLADTAASHIYSNTGTLIEPPDMEDSARITSADFGASSEQLVIGNEAGDVRFINALNNEVIFESTSHRGAVNGVHVGPGGRRIVSHSTGDPLTIWEIPDGRRSECERTELANATLKTFSRDGRWLFVFDQDPFDANAGQIRIIDTVSADVTYDSTKADFKPGGAVRLAKFDSVASTLALTFEEKESGVGIYVVRDGVIGSLLGRLVAFEPNSERQHESFQLVHFRESDGHIITVSQSGRVRLWDGQELTPLSILADTKKTISFAAINPAGTRLTVSDADTGAMRFIDLTASHTPLASLASTNYSGSLQFLPGKKLSLSWRGRSAASLWTPLSSSQPSRVFEHDGSLTDVQSDATGSRLLVSGPQSVEVWDTSGTVKDDSTATEFASKNPGSSSDDVRALLSVVAQEGETFGGAQFDANGTGVWVWSFEGKIRFFSLLDSSQRQIDDYSVGTIADLVFSPDDGFALGLTSGLPTNDIRLINIETRSLTSVLTNHSANVIGATFSADGKRFLSWDENAVIRVESGVLPGLGLSHQTLPPPPDTPQGQLSPPVARVEGAFFNAAATRFVSYGAPNAMVIWDVDTGQRALEPMWHSGTVEWAQYNTDETLLLSQDEYGSIYVWDATSGELRFDKSILTQPATPVRPVFVYNDTQVASAFVDGRLQVFDAIDGSLVRDIPAHDNDIVALAVSPDSHLVATASADDEIKVWWLGDSLLAEPTDSQGNTAIPAANAPRLAHVGVSTHVLPAASGLSPTLLLELAPYEPFFTWLRNNHIVLLGYIVLGILGLFTSWLWLRWRRRKVVLQLRRPGRGQGRKSVSVSAPAVPLYDGRPLLLAATMARERQSLGRGDLDMAATVNATIQNLGLVTPVARERMAMPVYLALIDRRSAGDQAAERVHALLNRLAESGVIIERFEFDHDPRLCQPRGGGRARSLRDLASAFHDARVLVFTEGHGLLHPITGRIRNFVARFDDWEHCAVMTPAAVAHWGEREVALAAAGFVVVPGSLAGFGAFTAAANAASDNTEVDDPWRPPFPSLLRERPSRWLAHDAPAPETVRQLCEQLRRYLGGRGYRWLCALAVYPELNWHITLFLGTQLRQADNSTLITEPLLVDLTRLPWLRHGRMPDWLRLTLIHELTQADENAVRTLLRNLLEQQLEENGAFSLNVAGPTRDRDRDWRRVLRGLFNTEPDQSALPDQVFVSFVFGKPAGSLELQAPDGWRRFVFERGISALGLRPMFVGGLTLLALGLATALFEAVAQRDPPNARTSPLWAEGGPHYDTAPVTDADWITDPAVPAALTRFAGEPLVRDATLAVKSDDEDYLLTTRGGPWARLWRVNPPTLIATIEQPGEAPIATLAFHSDGDRVLTSSQPNDTSLENSQQWVLQPIVEDDPEPEIPQQTAPDVPPQTDPRDAKRQRQQQTQTQPPQETQTGQQQQQQQQQPSTSEPPPQQQQQQQQQQQSTSEPPPQQQQQQKSTSEPPQQQQETSEPPPKEQQQSSSAVPLPPSDLTVGTTRQVREQIELSVLFAEDGSDVTAEGENYLESVVSQIEPGYEQITSISVSAYDQSIPASDVDRKMRTALGNRRVQAVADTLRNLIGNNGIRATTSFSFQSRSRRADAYADIAIGYVTSATTEQSPETNTRK